MTNETKTIGRTRGPLRKRLLEPAILMKRAPHWEGALEGTKGAAKGSTIRVKARIGFDYAMVEGEGRAVDFAAKGYAEGFTLSGALSGEAVDLQLDFDGEPFGRQPFLCTGTLSEDGREMTGDWSMACLDPEACGCSGAGGPFRLKRID